MEKKEMFLIQEQKKEDKVENEREEPFGKDLEAFLSHLRKKGFSKNTTKSYDIAIKDFFDLYPEITVKNLESYRWHLLRTYRANTVNVKVSAINHFLKYLMSQEPYRSAEPVPEWRGYLLQTVDIQKVSFVENVISQEDYEKMKKGLKEEGEDRWYFLVRYLAGTGARVSEVIQIKAEHVKLGYVDLYSKGGKIRRIFFPECLVLETLDWLEREKRESGFLFLNRGGKQITPRGINCQLKQIALRYQINPDTVYAHSFRHLFAKNFLQKTNDIALLSDLMGHESIETTRVYLKKSTMEQRKLIDEIITW